MGPALKQALVLFACALVVFALDELYSSMRLLDGYMRAADADVRSLSRVLSTVTSRVATNASTGTLSGELPGSSSGVIVEWRPGTRELDKLTDAQRFTLASGELVALKRPTPLLPSLSLIAPVRQGAQIVGTFLVEDELLADLSPLRVSLLRLARFTAILLIVGAVAAVVSGRFFIALPLRRIHDRLDSIADGDLTPRECDGSRGEFADLDRAMNGLAARLGEERDRQFSDYGSKLRSLQREQDTNRLESLGKLASGLAHELGTPLNVIIGRAQLLEEEDEPSEVKNTARIIRAQGERVSGIIRSFLELARQQPPRLAPHPIGPLVEDFVRSLDGERRRRMLTVKFDDHSNGGMAIVDPVQVQQVVSHILTNALFASQAGQSVRVEVSMRHAEPPQETKSAPGPYAVIEFTDEGVGIAETELPKIFEPFYTTREIGEGAGLGLSICFGIIREHSGWIEVRSTLGVGSTFTVFLPAVGDEREGT